MLYDKYYTKPHVAQICIEKMLTVVPAHAYFVEPSAGSGNFLFSETKKAFDILPESPLVTQADFLSVPFFQENLCFYGNPPFGIRNSLTKQFIRKCVSTGGARWIAFILPKAYKKHTLQKVFPLSWSLVLSEDLPHDSFSCKGEDYKIPCVFQVWEKDSNKVDMRATERSCFENNDFSIVGKEGNFFVMGASPRTLKLPEDVTENNRGYWLQSSLDYVTLLSRLQEVPWEGLSSAGGGVSWWTKTDFINQYEKYYKIGEFNGQQRSQAEI